MRAFVADALESSENGFERLGKLHTKSWEILRLRAIIFTAEDAEVAEENIISSLRSLRSLR